MTIIGTPEGIQFARMLAIRGALSIEVTTGMKHSRGSMLSVANKEMGTSHRTKKAALADLNERLAALGY